MQSMKRVRESNCLFFSSAVLFLNNRLFQRLRSQCTGEIVGLITDYEDESE